MKKVGIYIVGIGILFAILALFAMLFSFGLNSYDAYMFGWLFISLALAFHSLGGIIWGIGIFINKSKLKISMTQKVFCAICVVLPLFITMSSNSTYNRVTHMLKYVLTKSTFFF